MLKREGTVEAFTEILLREWAHLYGPDDFDQRTHVEAGVAARAMLGFEHDFLARRAETRRNKHASVT